MQYLTFGINALSGQVPPELGLLTDLRSLGLGVNNFNGSLPSKLGNLRLFEQIYIDSAGVGEIPPSFANLLNMQTVLNTRLYRELVTVTSIGSKLLNYFILQSQSMNPIPLVSENTTSDSCKALKGGAMAGAIHMHAQYGDPLLHGFMKCLLRRRMFSSFSNVLEVSWANFLDEMEAAKDLDDLLATHDKYLHSIVDKSLLGERSQDLYKTLFMLFDLISRFRSHVYQLFEGIYEFQARVT